MKAACFSVAAMDYFPKEEEYYAGGNALNQSIRLAGLGINSYFVGPLGTDTFGDRLFSLLSQSGVGVSFIERVEGSSANNRIVNDESGERIGEEGAWGGGVFEDHKLNEEGWESIQNFDLWVTHSSCPDFRESIRLSGVSLGLCDDGLPYKLVG